MGTEEMVVTNEADTVSDLESKIIRQVEYYFGDYNLGRDKFLKSQVKINDGWVSLETMLKFNRLKQLTEDSAAIATALKKSTNGLIEINEEGTEIRRSLEKPLPSFTEANRAEVDSRSIYAKGFQSECTLDELLEFFKKFGNAENVQMRRIKKGNRKFKGSVFVTFKTAEEAKQFLEQKLIEYKGTALLREMKKDYLKRKDIEFEERVKQGKERKQKKLESIKNETETDGDKPKSNDAPKPTPTEVNVNNFTKGCLLKLSGFAEKTMREHIKAVLEPHGTISYIDYSKGEPTAVIRFESPVAAEVLEKVSKEEDGEKKIEICEVGVTAIILEGEDETEYLQSIKKKSQRFKQKGGRRGGWQGRGGGGGRDFGRRNQNQRNKRKFGDDDDNTEKTSEQEPPTKVIKTEDSKE